MTFTAQHISVSINCDFGRAYAFVSNPENLPQWAQGLSQSNLEKSGDVWIAESPMGRVEIKFAGKNDYGVVDHDVILPSGKSVYNPLRVLRNGDGCEVVFTLYRFPDMTDEAYAADARMVRDDLERLRMVLEKQHG